MAYPTAAELGAYCGGVDTTPQTQANNAAIDWVVAHCNRQFVPYTATYQFTRNNVVRNGSRLMFFRDCLSITTLTNGDGSVIGSTNYIKLYNSTRGDPANASFYAIQLLPVSGYAFVESTVGYISVLGSWGYHGVDQPPAAVFSAILQIGALLYRTRSGGGGQIAQVQPSGVMVEGVQIPQAVLDLLKPYRRGVV